MVELGWFAPTAPVDARTARRGILWQHGRIRGLIEQARTIAELALDGKPPSSDAVAGAIGDLRSVLDTHLTFEEKVLIPLLRDDLPAGAPRAEQLIDDHRRQREMLAMLHREATAFPQLPMLAAKLAFLTAWLRKDMDEEERSLQVLGDRRD